MSPQALDAAAAEVATKLPGGGGPGDRVPDDPGGDGRGGGDQPQAMLYRLGLVLALASIAALFISLVVVYVVRSRTATYWQPVHPPPALWISTGMLLASSLTFEWARRALAKGEWLVYWRRVLLTAWLGASFLGAQLLALWGLYGRGYHMKGNPHASEFYLFAGLHGAHLIGGLLVLMWLLARWSEDRPRTRLAAELSAIYWHFMGLVWLGLFMVLMVVGR